MFVGSTENGENKKTLGLSSQRHECGWSRHFEEESGAGEDASGTPHQGNVRQEGGIVAWFEPAARGRLSSNVYAVFGREGERSLS